MVALHKTYVILPAYNEAVALQELVPTIARRLNDALRPFAIVVVNDGSSDNTSLVLRQFPSSYAVQEIKHDVNQGYGAALKTAFLWTAQNAEGRDALVTLDADNTQDPVYILPLIQKLEEGFDGVTASYVLKGGHSTGIPFMRQAMSRFLNALFHLAIPLEGVKMYTNGFRAYRVSALQSVYARYKNLLIEETGFPGGTEFFIKVAAAGGRLTEIPFTLHYERRGAQSKIRIVSTIRRYLKLVLKGRRLMRPTESPAR